MNTAPPSTAHIKMNLLWFGSYPLPVNHLPTNPQELIKKVLLSDIICHTIFVITAFATFFVFQNILNLLISLFLEAITIYWIATLWKKLPTYMKIGQVSGRLCCYKWFRAISFIVGLVLSIFWVLSALLWVSNPSGKTEEERKKEKIKEEAAGLIHYSYLLIAIINLVVQIWGTSFICTVRAWSKTSFRKQSRSLTMYLGTIAVEGWLLARITSVLLDMDRLLEETELFKIIIINSNNRLDFSQMVLRNRTITRHSLIITIFLFRPWIFVILIPMWHHIIRW